MRKFLVFLFLIIYPSIPIAHMAHYNKYNKLEMEILRNGEFIGCNYNLFNRGGNQTIDTTQIKLSVK